MVRSIRVVRPFKFLTRFDKLLCIVCVFSKVLGDGSMNSADMMLFVPHLYFLQGDSVYNTNIQLAR